MRRFLLATTALVAVSFAANGASAESLEDALAATYNNNPQVQAERANLRAVDEGVPQALAGWRPTVNFLASAGKQQQENSPAAPPNSPAEQQLQPRILSLTVTQPVYNGGATIAQTAQAEDKIQAERAKLASIESTALFTATQAYFDVLRDLAVVQLDDNNIKVLSRQLEATSDQFRVGSVTRTDVAQAEARRAQAQAVHDTDLGLLENDRANFTRAVGHAPVDLVQPTLRPVLPATRSEALTLASTKNPTVISSQFNEVAARDNVAQVKAKLLPTVQVVGNIGRSQEVTIASREQTNQSVVAQLVVPLYEAGTVWSQSRQAIELVGQAQGTTDDARRAAVQTATQSWETIQSARATTLSLQSTIRAATIALDGVTQQQQVGARTVLDVLNAQQELFADQLLLVRAQHDLNVAEFNLSQQIGRLNAADLALAVDLYDTQKHYQAVRNKAAGFSAGD